MATIFGSSVFLCLLNLVMLSTGCKISTLGMEDGRIKKSQITTTGVARGTTARGWQARLNKNIPSYGAWCAYVNIGSKKYRNYDQYIQIDLVNLTTITGIATQGRHPSRGNEHVTNYKISYRKDSRKWTFYNEKDQSSNEIKIFQGKDIETLMTVLLYVMI